MRKLTAGRGPSVVITAAPAGVAQEQAIEMGAPQGRLSFFGGCRRTISTSAATPTWFTTAEQGDTVRLTAEGDGAEAAVEALPRLLETDHDDGT